MKVAQKAAQLIITSFSEKDQSVTLKRLCNFSWKTQLSAVQYFLMQHNLIARISEPLLNTASSEQPPGTTHFS